MKQAVAVIVIVLVVFGGGYLYVKNKSLMPIDPKVAEFQADADRLIQGLQQYKAFFKHYPTGTPAEISAALSGQAEGKVVIFATANAKKNDKGEIVDTWGTPLQFYFSHDSVMIRSAGPNKVWEDSRHPSSDDLYRTDTK
ncbi:MAG: hypothetical protein DME18_06675 [Verrucomicrobia bacterium]|nr:MAG: hypothetical protein DME19_19155 [Verrucomicrobiota bacterium]PYM14437.1 MAG: hypothetical protein DME18_06675 [Verrucomicrobiota bacterium]